MIDDLSKKHTSPPDPLIPADTPFGYNVGINYESWEVGRTGYSIKADLNQIADDFKLIRTYHAAGFDDTPVIDPTQATVIDWMKKNPGAELVMGTSNAALAQLSGSTWSAGLMTSRSYTDQWVQMLIDAFGTVEKVKASLKTILLGNEIDQNGPPPTDTAAFNSYVNTWIPAVFDNLQASMKAAKLGSIPISTTIANYGTSNVVSVKVPDYIATNWATAWNNGKPFVMFNQYTQDNQASTDFSQVEAYFESVETALGSTLEVFVGETGYSTYWGADKQKKVVGDIFDWLAGQRNDSGKTVPLFVFDAFDRPAVTFPPDEVQYGLYGENNNFKPTGLKEHLKTVVPSWTDKHVGTSSKKHDSLYGTDGGDTIAAGDGDDIVLGLRGGDVLLGQAGADLLIGYDGKDWLGGGGGADFLDGRRGADTLNGGKGADTLLGGRGNDTLDGGPANDTLTGGLHRDTLTGGKGSDAFVFDFEMTKGNAAKHWDKITDFNTARDEIHLKSGRFSDLDLGKLPDDDTHITYKNDALFYDGVKFVKFSSNAPASLDDIDIIVIA